MAGVKDSSFTKAQPLSISSFEILKPISKGAYGQVVLAAKNPSDHLRMAC